MILSADINDNLIKTIVNNDNGYLDRATNSYIDVCNSFGVPLADIEDDPLPFLAMEYLRAYVGWEVCFNNAGLNSKMVDRDGILYDVYATKMPYYEKRLTEARNRLNKDIVKGLADTPAEYSYSVGSIYRA